MAWTDEMIANLKKMWDLGLTTGEIGKKLGVSKNSIVGKVHRLKLVSRPSPIKKKDEKEKAKPAAPVKEEKKNELKKSAPKKEADVKPAPATIKEVKKAEKIVSVKDEPIACAPLPRKGDKVTLTDLDNHTCRWPAGDPKDENFHFCGKKGSSWADLLR